MTPLETAALAYTLAAGLVALTYLCYLPIRWAVRKHEEHREWQRVMRNCGVFNKGGRTFYR